MTRVPFTYTWIEANKILAGSIPQLPEDLQTLRQLNIQSILTLTRRNPATYPAMNLEPFVHIQWSIPDNGLASDEIMTEARHALAACCDDNAPVYIHCRGGIGRTGTILLAYYVLDRGLTLSEAREIVKVRRNYQGNASAIDQGSPQREWIDRLEDRSL